MAKRIEQQRPGELAIGEVARQTGLRTSALRYYESVGVLPPPRRVNGQRRFDADVVRLLRTVRFAQDAGFSVAEIRTLFHGFGTHVPPAARWRKLADRKLAELFMTSSSSIEIADGIQMTIAPERLDDAASFIANERRCCRHLTFSLHVPPRDAPLLLRITGPGAAEELRALLR